jgi:hypothetical protein
VEDEIYRLIMQFLKNDEKAIEYYEGNKIGLENMLKMKRENADNFLKILKEIPK